MYVSISGVEQTFWSGSTSLAILSPNTSVTDSIITVGSFLLLPVILT